MTAPTQALILCGGLGERLRPLTEHIPKALAPVLGRPYLDYLIEQLRNEGITQILLLAGYRGGQIAAHVGDGKRHGVEIRTVEGATEWETGKRLAEARDLLDDRFVLLYCDNYAPFRLARLWEHHQAAGLPVTVTLASKEAGNLRLGKGGVVEVYDVTRRLPGLNYVEIGYMIVERDPVMEMNPARGSFSLVKQELAERGRLAAFAPGHTYYCSISDLKRLTEAEKLFSPRRLLLVDRDGVINRKAPRGEYVWKKEDFRWIPETIEGLRQLAEHGFEFIILSNQAGIGRGVVPAEAMTELHLWMVEEMRKQGILVKDVFVCPHHWEDKCICRKPLPALFYWASGKHRFWLERTLYVGDDPRDAIAAWNAGCGCVLLGDDEHARPQQTVPAPALFEPCTGGAVDPGAVPILGIGTLRNGGYLMIISRTPFRISFAGGGTDLRAFYKNEPGQVLSTAIDKYLYVILRRQLGLVEFKYRLNYSTVELCKTIDEIQHPIVREVLRMYNIDFPVEVTTFSDIPASTGLGSSSAFSVGLLYALSALLGKHVTKSQLSAAATHIEVDVLGRSMGKQDHYASAYGNLNVFTFLPDEGVEVEPVFYRPEVKVALQQHLMLFYTGLKRDASEVLQAQVRSTASKMDVLRKMKSQVGPLRDILSSGRNLHEFGQILHEGWLLKRSITPEISCLAIDRWYEKARSLGAIGGKLLGAGGGGFLLLFVEPQNQRAVAEALNELYRVPFGFDNGGTRITYYDQSGVI